MFKLSLSFLVTLSVIFASNISPLPQKIKYEKEKALLGKKNFSVIHDYQLIIQYLVKAATI